MIIGPLRSPLLYPAELQAHCGLTVVQLVHCARNCVRDAFKISCLFLCSKFQVGITHDVVPVKDSPCLMTSYHHGNSLGTPGTDHVTEGCPPEIVEESYTNIGVFASR